MKKVKVILTLFLISIILTACSNTETAVKTSNELDQYKKRIEVLEKENKELHQKQNEITLQQKQGILTLNYIVSPEKHRFVEQNISLLLTPHIEAQVLNEIESNTVVEVHDFVEVNQEIWLYVTIPVFDTPTNMKGWIKETNTKLYTIENQSKVKSPITIKENTNVHKVDLFTEIQSSEATKAEIEQTCVLTDEQGEFVALSCAGGANYIVNKSEVMYPPLN